MKFRFFTAIALFSLAFTSCDVDKTSEGEMPTVDVDVDADAGELPTYDVDWADVDVKTTTKMVDVPKVRVVMEKEEVEVPVIDVDWPGDDTDREEMTLMVEADVDQEADLEIQQVYTTGERIYVVATLDKDGEMLDNETMRISDQIVINAPDVDVRYYIVGDRPDGFNNTRYRYVSSMNDLRGMMKNGKLIYERSSK